jgi:type I restriction enzyme M protein
MATEASVVIKKIVPYLQRRGYSLENNLYFGERAQKEQEQAGFVDILVKRSSRSPRVLFLIEAKRDTARLTPKHRDQAIRYGRALNLPFVVTTNGAEFELYNVVTNKKLKFNGSVIGKIPHYENLDHALTQFRVNPSLDNLLFTGDQSLPYRPGLSLPQLHALIRRCHNIIRDVEKDEEEIFSDFSKLLFLKLLEEKEDREELDFSLPYTYRFYELGQRRQEADQVKDAILSMMQQVVRLREYGTVMTPNLRMQRPATYLTVVAELAKASFSDSELDVRGSAFEYFVKTSLKGKKLGQFFTPRPLVRLMLSLLPLEQLIADILDPQCTVKVIDPACGSGGFLLAAMHQLLQKIHTERSQGGYSQERADFLKKRIQKHIFWGAEANQSIASTAKMNMIIAGDGFANIKHGDSLTEDIDFLRMGEAPQANFVVSNPPFGMSEARSLPTEDLGRYDVTITKTQALFLQKMVRISKPRAKICTVIDEGMLNTGAMARMRRHLLEKCHIDAVIDLPEVTFKPNKINVRCSVLLLTKKTTDDESQVYPIRMIQMEKIGYDSMGEEGGDVSIQEMISLVRARWSDMGHRRLSLEDTGNLFHSYPLDIHHIVAEEDVRLDFKYYDPAILDLIDNLINRGAKPLLDIVVEPIKRGKSPSKSDYNVNDADETIVVKAGNIGRIAVVGELDTISQDVYERLTEAHIMRNDLLLASTGEGTLGKAAVFDEDKEAIADSHVTILRLDTEQLDPHYAAWYLRSEYGQAQIHRLYTGTTGLIELPEDEVKRILILAPPSLENQRHLSGEWLDKIYEAQVLEQQAQQKRDEARQAFIRSLYEALP